MLAILAGAYRLRKRQLQQVVPHLFGPSIPTGMITKLGRYSAATSIARRNELRMATHQCRVTNIEET